MAAHFDFLSSIHCQISLMSVTEMPSSIVSQRIPRQYYKMDISVALQPRDSERDMEGVGVVLEVQTQQPDGSFKKRFGIVPREDITMIDSILELSGLRPRHTHRLLNEIRNPLAMPTIPTTPLRVVPDTELNRTWDSTGSFSTGTGSTDS